MKIKLNFYKKYKENCDKFMFKKKVYLNKIYFQ